MNVPAIGSLNTVLGALVLLNKDEFLSYGISRRRFWNFSVIQAIQRQSKPGFCFTPLCSFVFIFAL